MMLHRIYPIISTRTRTLLDGARHSKLSSPAHDQKLYLLINLSEPHPGHIPIPTANRRICTDTVRFLYHSQACPKLLALPPSSSSSNSFLPFFFSLPPDESSARTPRHRQLQQHEQPERKIETEAKTSSNSRLSTEIVVVSRAKTAVNRKVRSQSRIIVLPFLTRPCPLPLYATTPPSVCTSCAALPGSLIRPPALALRLAPERLLSRTSNCCTTLSSQLNVPSRGRSCMHVGLPVSFPPPAPPPPYPSPNPHSSHPHFLWQRMV